ncbi:UNKNOWN [Stylonychia lemnae]|uniref:Uncharacterized protein n=1 Tax=Stylonychia lemnae TaxID=5949 RepID=A0A078A7W6_STYLE|nr:UNKNOWN [Stylonychia lemnae]|eukprot:CDW77667.1 UNKNOWN [Stylonychia lemnae]
MNSFGKAVKLIAISALLSINLSLNTSANESQSTQPNLTELKSKLSQLEGQIQNTEAKLEAISTLKMHHRRQKLVKIGNSKLDEISSLNKLTLHQLADVDHVRLPNQRILKAHDQDHQFDVKDIQNEDKSNSLSYREQQIRNPLLNQVFDRGQIIGENEVTTFELMPVKTFKSLHSAIISTVTVSASINGIISVHDINGNLLDQINIEEDQKVISLAQPIGQDDMLIAVLTDKANVYTFKAHIKDYFGETNSTSQNETTRKSSKKVQNQPALYQVLKLSQEKKVNLKELIEKANATFDKEQIQFKQVMFTRSRGRLLLVFLDNTNHITTTSIDINFLSRYLIDTQNEEIIGLRKQQVSIMFFTKSKIGFTKITDKSVSNNYCESGASQLVNIVVDLNLPSVIYAATNRGEIYIYEASNRADIMDCKPKGRLSTPSQVYQNEANSIKLEVASNVLYALLGDGSLQMFKTNDVDKLIKSEYQGAVYKTETQKKSPIQNDLVNTHSIHLSVSNNFVAFNGPYLVDGKHQIDLIESMHNAKVDASGLGSSTSWDTTTIRYMMILAAIALVGGYQYVKFMNNKKEKDAIKQNLPPKNKQPAKTSMKQAQPQQMQEEDDDQVENADSFSQMRQMMEEMERLKQQTSQMTNQLGSIGGKIANTKKDVNSLAGASQRGNGPNSQLIEEQSDEDY